MTLPYEGDVLRCVRQRGEQTCYIGDVAEACKCNYTEAMHVVRRLSVKGRLRVISAYGVTFVEAI